MRKPLKSRRSTIGSTRFELHLAVQFLGLTVEGIEVHGEGVVRNLSMRGALIETHASFKRDDRLTLYVTLPNQVDLLEIPTVAVRWVKGHQLGVEFLKLDGETSRQLMRYLAGIHNAARAEREAMHTR